MRTTAYFSQIKDSLIEFVKKSTDSTDSSKGEVSEPKSSFYREFLSAASPLTCRISKVETLPRINFKRSYAVYVIEVETDVVQYVIKQRYSEFQKLYARCSKLQKLSTSFPPRTIFQAGWSEQVTNHRLMQLNKFLQEVNNQATNQLLKMELYDFIDLYHKYQQERVDAKQNSTELEVTDEFLLLELVKLNENPKSMLNSLERIKLSISERKKRLGYDIAKQLLTGFQNYDGLLAIIMNSENELVIMLGLKLINWLISPEMNRDYEVFRRILLKCIPNNLILEQFEELRSHCQLSLEYFKLLNYYFSCRNDVDIQKIAKFYDSGKLIEEQYARWLKYNNMY